MDKTEQEVRIFMEQAFGKDWADKHRQEPLRELLESALEEAENMGRELRLMFCCKR